MMNTQNLTFGEFLQRKREEKQITLRKMAEMLHVSAPYLSDIEKGRRNPPEMEKLEQIAQILLLTDEEKSAMLDLAGKMRNSVAPDFQSSVNYAFLRLRSPLPCALPVIWTPGKPSGCASWMNSRSERGNLNPCTHPRTESGAAASLSSANLKSILSEKTSCGISNRPS